MNQRWSNRKITQLVSEANFGSTERRWQKWMKWHRVQIRAREMAADTTDEKAVRKAVGLLIDEGILAEDAIAEWLLHHRYAIPVSSMGEYLGGKRPKFELPL